MDSYFTWSVALEGLAIDAWLRAHAGGRLLRVVLGVGAEERAQVLATAGPDSGVLVLQRWLGGLNLPFPWAGSLRLRIVQIPADEELLLRDLELEVQPPKRRPSAEVKRLQQQLRHADRRVEADHRNWVKATAGLADIVNASAGLLRASQPAPPRQRKKSNLAANLKNLMGVLGDRLVRDRPKGRSAIEERAALRRLHSELQEAAQGESCEVLSRAASQLHLAVTPGNEGDPALEAFRILSTGDSTPAARFRDRLGRILGVTTPPPPRPRKPKKPKASKPPVERLRQLAGTPGLSNDERFCLSQAALQVDADGTPEEAALLGLAAFERIRSGLEGPLRDRAAGLVARSLRDRGATLIGRIGEPVHEGHHQVAEGFVSEGQVAAVRTHGVALDGVVLRRAVVETERIPWLRLVEAARKGLLQSTGAVRQAGECLRLDDDERVVALSIANAMTQVLCAEDEDADVAWELLDELLARVEGEPLVIEGRDYDEALHDLRAEEGGDLQTVQVGVRLRGEVLRSAVVEVI